MSAESATGPIGIDAPGGAPEDKDARQLQPGYGRGGVPMFLLILYLGFLTFFTWYTLTYQLPDFLNQGPGQAKSAPAAQDG